MNGADFQLLSLLLKERSGLVIGSDKEYLLESRLVPVARKWKLQGLPELVAALRDKPDSGLTRDVVEAMTTNESFFFRDIKPFDYFKQLILPHLVKSRAANRTLRIWSAACSSGQEPYSLAMIIDDLKLQFHGWRIEILATDLSEDILDKAKAGIYSQFEVQRGLPIQLLIKYFKQQGDRWQIDEAIRGMISFRRFNLLEDLKSLGRFDVIFCRNVLIYFDRATKASVLERMAKQMAPDGYLCLGGAETVLGLTNALQPLPDYRGLYRLAEEQKTALPPLARVASR